MEYVDVLTENDFVLDELIEILSYDIEDEIKISVLRLTDKPISIIGKNYSNIVNEYVLQNNLDEGDLIKLFNDYKKYDLSTQSIIYELSIKYIFKIIDDPKNVSNELINKLLHLEDLDNGIKVDLFISLLPMLNREQIKAYFTLLGLFDYIRLFEPRSRPKFKISATNEKILQGLKNRNLINDFEVDPKREGYYKIIKIKSLIRSLPKELL